MLNQIYLCDIKLKKIFDLINKNFFFFFFLIFLIHGFTIFLPSAGFDFLFIDAVKFFHHNDKNYINHYFEHQANSVFFPLAYSYLLKHISPDYLLFGFRFINSLFILLIYPSVKNIITFFFNKNFATTQNIQTLTFLILLNPLVWIFSARATVDFAPVILGIYASSEILRNRRLFFNSLLLGLAIIGKYHNIVFLALIFIGNGFMQNKINFYNLFAFNNIKNLLLTTLICLLLFILFQFYNYSNFRFIISPEKFQTLHLSFNNSFLSNFVTYSGYVLIVCGILFLGYFNLVKNNILYLIFFLIIGLFLVHDSYELSFGSFFTYSTFFYTLLISLFSSIYFVINYFNFKKPLLLFSLFTLIFLSLFPAANRYLILIIPFLSIEFFNTLQEFKYKNIVTAVAALLFVLANYLIQANQYTFGNAAEEIYSYIYDNGLLADTNMDIIYRSHGDRIHELKIDKNNFPEFSASQECDNSFIFKSKFKLLLISKELCLIKN